MCAWRASSELLWCKNKASFKLDKYSQIREGQLWTSEVPHLKHMVYLTEKKERQKQTGAVLDLPAKKRQSSTSDSGKTYKKAFFFTLYIDYLCNILI